jgi:hypothetical protein
MIMLSFNVAAPDLVLSRSSWAKRGDVSEVTVRVALIAAAMELSRSFKRNAVY